MRRLTQPPRQLVTSLIIQQRTNRPISRGTAFRRAFNARPVSHRLTHRLPRHRCRTGPPPSRYLLLLLRGDRITRTEAVPLYHMPLDPLSLQCSSQRRLLELQHKWLTPQLPPRLQAALHTLLETLSRERVWVRYRHVRTRGDRKERPMYHSLLVALTLSCRPPSTNDLPSHLRIHVLETTFMGSDSVFRVLHQGGPYLRHQTSRTLNYHPAGQTP